MGTFEDHQLETIFSRWLSFWRPCLPACCICCVRQRGVACEHA